MRNIGANDASAVRSGRRIEVFPTSAKEDLMMQPRPSGSPIQSLREVKGRPATMSLPVERRDLTRRAAVIQRIAAEFREMPGLVLSIPQASRLLGLDEPACERVLATLAREGLLRRRPGGTYGRA
jgi:hypothetical protein